MAQEKQHQRIPGYITTTEQELIASAAALERRDARSWVRLVLLDAARERIVLGMPVPIPPPLTKPTIEGE